jgi:DNA-binding MarR family transcriptional regulator
MRALTDPQPEARTAEALPVPSTSDRDGELPSFDMARQAGSQCFCFNLRRASRLVTQLYNEAFRPLDLQATQYSLLMALRAMGPVPMQELAEPVGMDRTTLSRNVGVLCKRGWTRVQPGDDRRVREISLTDSGRDILRRAYPLWRETQVALAARLGTDNGQPLLAELDSIVAAATV